MPTFFLRIKAFFNVWFKKTWTNCSTASLLRFVQVFLNQTLLAYLFSWTYSQICWISWKRSPLKFIGKTLSLCCRAQPIEMNTSGFLFSVNASLVQMWMINLINSFTGSWRSNRHNRRQTIHPTENFISMNLLQKSCLIAWAW